MQACPYSDQTNMVSSIIKPAKDSYCEHSSAMPTRIGSPTSVSNLPLNSKAHQTNGNGKASPPSSPRRLTRSRVARCQQQNKAATIYPVPKTNGASSNDHASTTDQPNTERLVCPELAISYANTVISSRLGTLSAKQNDIESRLTRLTGRLRQKQLKLAQSHARKQLDFHKSKPIISHVDASKLSATDQSDRDVEMSKPLPIQVDGASDELSTKVKVESPSKGEESFSSLESTFLDDGEWAQLGERLEFTKRLVDDDMTDCSSDEETDLDVKSNARRAELTKEWEKTRTLVGSKWAWLERRISELNKQICRLDYKIQRRPSRENSTFTNPQTSIPPTSNFTLSNGGTLLEQLHRSGGLLGVCKGGSKPGNGWLGHSQTGQYLPQLLLPGGISGTKLQVKDLLAPSPIGRNFSMFVEEAGEVCARTRPLERRAKRKIIRKTTTHRSTKKRGMAKLDPSHHPQLSLPHELPSRLLLDGPVKQILGEHSYARQPLSKRRKAASSLSQLSTPRSVLRMDLSLSSTPSPVGTPSSASSSISKVVSRRKVYQLTHQPSSLESLGPTSPPTHSRPDTPTQPPLKKKRVLTSTPSYDIDNIVIPYSMAASARLEKLEYKEILTPRWREVNQSSIPGVRVHPIDINAPSEEGVVSEEEEDTSGEYFTLRHDKCEQQEKKRFLNFISGGQRKRGRPQSIASTPDPLSVSSPLPMSASKQRRVFESPTPSESELFASQYMGVLPWQPRDFPLVDMDLDALTNPPPPPSIIRGPLSPRHFSESHFKSRTPSTASTLATPLSSPLSTPCEETPSISPTEWMVVSTQVNNCNGQSIHRDSCYKPANGSHIVLKLTKRA